MIKNLRDSLNGATIAILGSGPSLNLYDERDDFAIAVNGASLIKKRYDIFLAGDNSSPNCDWWQGSSIHPNSNYINRIVSSYIAPFDENLYPDVKIRKRLQQNRDEHILKNKSRNKFKLYPFIDYIPDKKPFDGHQYFRFGGFGKEFINNISPDQEVMYWGGTISAIAIQLSLIMGADNVHIYGCNFSNLSGKNYHYSCSKVSNGSISKEQLDIMQLTINRFRDYGKSVSIHGNSLLK